MAWEETLKVWTIVCMWFDFLCSLDVVIFYTRWNMWKPCRTLKWTRLCALVDPQKMSEPTDITWVQDTCHPSLHKSGRKRQKCERKRLNVWLLSVWRKLHFGCFCKFLQVSASICKSEKYSEIFRDIPLPDIFPISSRYLPRSPQVFPSSDTSGQSVWLEPRCWYGREVPSRDCQRKALRRPFDRQLPPWKDGCDFKPSWAWFKNRLASKKNSSEDYPVVYQLSSTPKSLEKKRHRQAAWLRSEPTCRHRCWQLWYTQNSSP